MLTSVTLTLWSASTVAMWWTIPGWSEPYTDTMKGSPSTKSIAPSPSGRTATVRSKLASGSARADSRA